MAPVSLLPPGQDIFAVDVKVQVLIKLLVANVAAELEAVVAHDLAVILVELKGVPRLWQLALEIVAKKTKRAVQGDVRDSLELGTESRMNAAAKAGTHGSVGIGRGAEGSTGGVH